jgi:hypothetical protein
MNKLFEDKTADARQRYDDGASYVLIHTRDGKKRHVDMDNIRNSSNHVYLGRGVFVCLGHGVKEKHAIRALRQAIKTIQGCRAGKSK